MLTPEEIETREFLVSLRGYDRDEVHAFLGRVAEHVRELHQRMEAAGLSVDGEAADGGAAAVTGDPAEAGTAAGTAAAEPAVVAAQPAAPAATTPSALFAEIGKETQRILEAAQQAGLELQRKAQADAERSLAEAQEQAARIAAEAQQLRQQAETDVAELVRARDGLADQLRGVGSTIDEVLAHLASSGPEVPGGVPGGLPGGLPGEPGADVPMDLPGEPGAGGADGALPPVRTGDDAAVEELQREALQPLRPELTAALTGALEDVRTSVLGRLGGSTGGDVLLDEDLQVVRERCAPILSSAWQAGLATSALVGEGQVPADAQPPEDVATALCEDTREWLGSVLAPAVLEGRAKEEDDDALADRVGSALADLGAGPLRELVDLHLLRAYELGAAAVQRTA